jgi:hypothetical protein
VLTRPSRDNIGFFAWHGPHDSSLEKSCRLRYVTFGISPDYHTIEWEESLGRTYNRFPWQRLQFRHIGFLVAAS